MSGEKIARWEVERNAEREARVGAAMRAEILDLMAREAQMREDWRVERNALGEPEARRAVSEPTLPLEDVDSETLAVLREDMRTRLRDTERAAARDIALLKARERLRAHAGNGKREPSAKAEAAAAKAAEIVAEVAGWAELEERAIIESAMVAVAEAASEHTAEVHLLELRRVAQSLRERAQRARQCAAWRDRLTGLDGKAVEAMRDEIEVIAQGAKQASGDFARRVESCAMAAEAEADQRYAEQVLIEELGKLGYWVDTTLKTASPGDGQVLLAHPHLDEYRVEFEDTRSAREGRVRLVRTDDGHDDPLSPAQRAATDTAHEERWCGDLAQAIRRMEGRSVRGRIIKSVRPGAAPVMRIRTVSAQDERIRPATAQTTNRLRERRRATES